MASPQTNDVNAPRFPPPPPPFRPRAPPPPPPSPPSDNHPTVIVIVLISFGSLFFFAFLAAALFCFLKKKKKKAVQEVEIIHVDEHKNVKAIIPGPHGTQSVILSVEDDVHIGEVIGKKETFGHAGLHAKSAQGESGSTNKERGSSSSSFDQQQFDKILDHKSITPS